MPQATTETSPPTPVSSGYADVNGIKLYHEIYGQGEPLVLIHGGLQSLSQLMSTNAPEREIASTNPPG